MKDRVIYPNSPTLELLNRFDRTNLGEVLRLILEDMNRYDVVLMLIPLLVNNRKNAISNTKANISKDANLDSGVFASGEFPSTSATLSSSSISQEIPCNSSNGTLAAANGMEPHLGTIKSTVFILFNVITLRLAKVSLSTNEFLSVFAKKSRMSLTISCSLGVVC